MQVTYKNKQLRKICENATEARKLYGQNMARKINQRINEMIAADSVDMMIKCRIGRCHLLAGDMKGQYAVDLEHPYRLIFEKVKNEIKIVKILEIVDYH